MAVLQKKQAGRISSSQWKDLRKLEERIDIILNIFVDELTLPSLTLDIKGWANQKSIEVTPAMLAIIKEDYEAAGWTVELNGFDLIFTS